VLTPYGRVETFVLENVAAQGICLTIAIEDHFDYSLL